MLSSTTELLGKIPQPPHVDEDTIFNKILSLNGHVWAWIICLGLALIAMKMWKSPLGKGLMIGAALVFLFFITKK